MSTPTNLDAVAQRFDAHRRHLRAVQLPGPVVDPDEAVVANVDNLTGWFAVITAREAVDRLRARERRAEQPPAGPDELVRLAKTVSAPAALPRRTAKHPEIVAAFVAASRGGNIATSPGLPSRDVVRRVERPPVPADVPTTLRGVRAVAGETGRFARRAREGAVVLVDGMPGAGHRHRPTRACVSLVADRGLS